MSSNEEIILHCQKQLKRDISEERALHYLRRLSRLKIRIKDLIDTGVGKTVNQLGRNQGIIGHEASKLVRKWKSIVEELQENQNKSGSSEENESEEEDDEEDEPKLTIDLSNSVKIEPEPPEEDEEDEDQHEHVSNWIEKNHIVKQEVLDQENGHSSSDELDKPLLPPPIKGERLSEDSEEEVNDFQSWRDTITSNYEEAQADPIKIEKLSDPESEEEAVEERRRSEKKRKKSHKKDKKESRDKDSRGEGSVKVKVEKHEEKNTADHDKKRKRDKEHHHSSREKSENHLKERDRGEKRHRDPQPVENGHSSSKSKSSTEESERKKFKSDKETSRHANGHSHSPTKTDIKPDKRELDKELKLKEKESPKKKEDKDKKKAHSSGSENETSKKPKITVIGEIDSTSGFNFADVLGSIDKARDGSKKSKKSSSSNKQPPHHPSVISKSVVKSNSEKEKKSNSSSSKKHKSEQSPAKNHSESFLDISPNYKPMPSRSRDTPSSLGKKEEKRVETVASAREGDILDLDLDDIDDLKEYNTLFNSDKGKGSSPKPDYSLSHMISSRKEKTKVYSGNKIKYSGEVPRLFDMCLQIIQDNISDLGYTGGVPYDILKPVFAKTTATQLFQIEEFNPYLIESTDELWEFHCKRDFRGKIPDELESWRELYLRSLDEREALLENLKNKMKKSMDSATPVRKAKLAYFENTTSTKYNKAKAATIKNGMKTLKKQDDLKGQAKSRMEDEKAGPSSNSAGTSSSSSRKAHSSRSDDSAVIIHSDSRASNVPAPSKERKGIPANQKPKKAPLMAKTMRLIKTLHRR